ncbi:sodium/calcium exchanger 3 isoform X4 [Octopus bimaculoides]|nr:sodium/calcium exchanger 3 isoform X4 [Octopus bimaculoides]|eukprot:XP_014786863.1 PREDICTED: sodium/calcium exchanger 3-like isoform X3 [Octopus bimaculoides]
MANTTPSSNAVTNPYCIKSSDNGSCSGLILPILNEDAWPVGFRAFVYLLGLFWCFLGVSIIADTFMCSIERITSKTRKIRVADSSKPNGFHEIEVKVWNDTVANLSLLALGTSAPEILLSVIEILGNGFCAGALGPSTIVGSAAFNLFVISGICIMTIPAGEFRRIKSMRVFGITSFFCLFSYMWLAIVLLVSSPNVVELWEAVVTFLFFPLLILIAYLVDRKCCMEDKSTGIYEIAMAPEAKDKQLGKGTKASEEEPLDKPESTEENVFLLARDLARTRDITDSDAGRLAAATLAERQSHGRGWYRINANRTLTGGQKLTPVVMEAFKEIRDDLSAKLDNPQLHEELKLPKEEREASRVRRAKDHSEGGKKAVVEFTASGVAVLESEKKVRVGIRRTGKMDIPVQVRVETVPGTATPGSDYKPLNEIIQFQENEMLRTVYVEIIDDFEWEPDEFFFVQLSLLPDNTEVTLAKNYIMQVTIINDDEPGVLEFTKPSVLVTESSRKVKIPVKRSNGADGHVSVKWKTKDMTAHAGVDYFGGEGELTFENGEILKNIEVFIYDTKTAEKDECFQLSLLETGGGATLGKITKTIVTIVKDEEFNSLVGRIVNMTKLNLDALQLDTISWGKQFENALNVNGGDLETATAGDYILHFASFAWKALFACVPPPSLWGGWPTFFVSLAVIGLMTAIIGDLAGIFGCLINLDTSITAITLVALGTSMPDTFASRTAALMEKYADASVGNVNGSNSVNVFLGLGLPWLIAAIYWHTKGQIFVVDAGSLGFSVIIYTTFAIIAILLLVMRRSLKIFGKAELGGATVPKMVTGVLFIFLWVLYVLLSSLQTKQIIEVSI